MRFGVKASLVLLWLSACSNITYDVEGKSCSSDRKCLPGYECNSEKICVRQGEANGGDASSSGGNGSNGDDSGTGDGDASVQPPDRDASSTVSPEAGSGVSDGLTADGGYQCDAGWKFYRDSDGDSYGDPKTEVSCPPDSSQDWVTNADDCNDDNMNVFKGPTESFGVGYDDPFAPGGKSFDYNCDGVEEGDPGNSHQEAPDCGSRTSLNCENATPGYEPTGRNGSSANPLCGSDQMTECVVDGLNCVANTYTALPYKCR